MISVAICTYNGELYIKELLDSILNQTMPVDEIVICDDKSTDNTIPIVQEIASTHNNATFIIIKNNTKLGVRKNFEKALNICNGDIKFLSDQDDIWFPTKVKTIYDYFNTNIVKTVVFTNALLIDNKNKPFSNKTLFECVGLDEYGIQLCNEGFLLNIFLTNGRTYGTTMAIRKNVNCFFSYPTLLYHDYILAIEAILNNSLGFIIEPLMYYRIHKDQTCGIGESALYPPRINIYDVGHVDMTGYPYPQRIKEELQMRDKRYHWIAGLKGLFHIVFNWKCYKYIYQNHWISFIKNDINHTINSFKQRRLKTEKK